LVNERVQKGALKEGKVAWTPETQETYKQAINHFALTLSARRPSKNFATPYLNYEAERFLRSLRRLVIRRPLWIYLVLLGAGFGSAYAMAHFTPNTSLHSATFYLGVPAILLGAYQAWLNSLVKQADQMKDNLTSLYSKELFKTWFDLFYNYKNDVFIKLDALRDESEKLHKALEEENVGRAKGSHRWHPVALADTIEEGRIDALLSHLNILGDYYERGMLSLDEIGGVAEYYLLGVHNCYAFQAYIHLIRQGFRGEGKYHKDGGKTRNREKFVMPPFRHACLLLHDLNLNSKKREDEVYELFDKMCHQASQQENVHA
jgi:hypothetical protein